MWINPSGFPNFPVVLARGNPSSGGHQNWYLQLWASNVEAGFSQGSTGVYLDVAPVSAGTTSYLAATWDGTYIRIYENGTLVGTSPNYSAYTPDTAGMHADIGGMPWIPSDGNGFLGMIDEARVSSSIRSADWIKTEYNNQESPATFVKIGAEQSSPAFNPFWFGD